MRRTFRYSLVLVALVLVYLVMFPSGTGEELVVDREWAISFATAPLGSGPGPARQPPVAVRLDDVFGYLNSDGTLTYRGMVAYGTALGEEGFVNFGRDPDQLVLQGRDGSYRATLPQSGYPFFAGNNLFVTGGGDTVLTGYAPDGRMRWRRAFATPMSTVASDGDLTAVGLLSGGLVVLDAEGEVLEMDDSANRYEQTVYGVAIDSASRVAAAAYGPARPSVVLYGLWADEAVPFLSVEMARSPGRPLAIAISGGNVFFEDGGIHIVNAESGIERLIPAAREIRAISVGDRDLVTTLGTGANPDPQLGFRYPAELVFLDTDGVVPVRLEFGSRTSFLAAVGNWTYLGVDDRVLKFRVNAE